MFYMETINNYIQQLEYLKEHDQTIMSLIAKYLLNNLDSKREITEARQIANTIGISNAMISKFCKKLGYKNIYEVLFLQKITKNFSQEHKNKNQVVNVIQAVNLIEKARKIFFLGVSNGFLVNQDFARKINRLDKWTYVTDNKYEQIGNARLLGASDLLIATSVSLQHRWMQKIIKTTPAKVILISHVLPHNLKSNVTLYFQVFSSILDTVHRNVTYEPRTNALKIFDQIYQKLTSYGHNKCLLTLTRYNF